MDVYSVSSGSSAYDTSAYQSSIDDSYDMFLSLLTTQLQNQNPTEPMDSDKITEQFLNYSSIEQQVQANSMLSSMLSMIEDLQNGNPTEYLGKEVTFFSSTAALKDGAAKWTYSASTDVDEVAVVIKDADGNKVYSETVTSAEAGMNDFTWDGVGTDGTEYTNGDLFTISLEETVGDTTKAISSISTTGIVEKVDWSSGSHILTVDGQLVGSSKVGAIASAQ
ncbi:flagellar hook assembly protein FlgD [Aestuariispira insulae]|uniref:Basal-body rod modification protein FlgD n=1 Tax=Aestuariispira insulae TaxID=1461337 RepID=A0A3D9H5J9_9PROT|nr:flagellar hook capping FlgD N-terminal domain-containing protein [Aestuariispira insulae]RED44803.1 flagellar basal-body rod modification protein FlgD [Aestuariispira insulae]